jgi:hypothetical protein
MPTHTTRARLIPAAAALLFVAACGDGSPLAPTSELDGLRPSFSASPQAWDPIIDEPHAYSVADGYSPDQPLSPFGVSYETFFDNPESVADWQFEAEEWRIPTWRTAEIDYDSERLVTYCGGGGGGGGGPFEPWIVEPIAESEWGEGESVMFASTCEQRYNSCISRCRRLWSSRARALCYAGCMVAYADCLRRRR